MNKSATKSKTRVNGTMLWSFVSLFTWVLSRVYLLEFEYAKTLGYAIAMITLIPFAIFLTSIFKDVSSWD
jgi:hypothetical protein